MYRENEFASRRDGSSDDYLRRMLDGGCSQGDEGANGTNVPQKRSWGLVGDYPLAMVYSPIQEWRELYDNETGLSRGTIFKELDLPFTATWGDVASSPVCPRGCGGVKNG